MISGSLPYYDLHLKVSYKQLHAIRGIWHIESCVKFTRTLHVEHTYLKSNCIGPLHADASSLRWNLNCYMFLRWAFLEEVPKRRRKVYSPVNGHSWETNRMTNSWEADNQTDWDTTYESFHNSSLPIIHLLQVQMYYWRYKYLFFQTSGSSVSVVIRLWAGLLARAICCSFSSSPHPHRLCGPPNHLSNGYWGGFIPQGNAAGTWSWPLTSL